MASEAKTRELNYVMVQHMGYSAETRLERHLKAGQRRQRLMLGDGRRIRDKGERFDEVSFDDVLENHEMLLNGVRTGALRVCRPDNLEALTLVQLGDLLEQLAKDFKKDLKIDETLLEPLVGSNLKDDKVWVEKLKTTPAPVDAPVAPTTKLSPAEVGASTEPVSPTAVEATPAPTPEPAPAEAPAAKVVAAPAKVEDPKHHAKKGRR